MSTLAFLKQNEHVRSQETAGRESEESVAKNDLPVALPNSHLGVKQLVSGGSSPEVDIVAIHGLDGHREKSWTINKVLWLETLLADKIPTARILTYGYDADTHGKDQLTNQTMYDHAETLVGKLASYRIETKAVDRPIIFVAHSLGGIVLKYALIHANQTNEAHLARHKDIEVSTYGILFLGTPHQGSESTNLFLLLLQIQAIYRRTKVDLVKHLPRDSEFLSAQLSQFAAISDRFDTRFFFEAYPSRLPGGQLTTLVPKASAVVPGAVNSEAISINKDHRGMNKFSTPEDDDFQTICVHLKSMVDQAPQKIKERWEKYKRIKDINQGRNPLKRHRSLLPRLPYPMGGTSIVGRDNVLKKIHQQFFEYSREVVALYGIGGIGKTRLAVEYIFAHQFDYDIIFWINADTEESIKEAFVGSAKQLIGWKLKNSGSNDGLNYRDMDLDGLIDEAGHITKDPEQAKSGVIAWLSAENSEKWLLIFDNADHLERVYLPELFPTRITGRILITSRDLECKDLVDQYQGFSYPVEALEPDDALKLLSRIAEQPADDDAREIVTKLGYLPLALETAGAYIYNHTLLYGEYLERFDRSWNRIFHQPRMLYNKSLLTTWEVSYETIKCNNPAAANLLLVCAFCNNENIPEYLVRGSKGTEIDEVLQPLLRFSFVKRSSAEKAFSIHPLVHIWARERLEDDEKTKRAAEAVRLVGDSLTPLNICNFCEDLPDYIFNHIEQCSTHALRYGVPEFKLDRADYLSTLKSLFKLGLVRVHFLAFEVAIRDILGLPFQETEYTTMEIMRRSLKAQEEFLGLNDPIMVQTLKHLYVTSLAHLQKNDIHSTSFSALLIHLTSYGSGELRFDEAEKLLRHSLEVTQATLGPDDKTTLAVGRSFGVALLRQHRFNEAEEQLRRVFTTQKIHQGPDDLGTILTGCVLGQALDELCQFKEAEELVRHAIKVAGTTWGPLHDATLDFVAILGTVLSDQHRFEEAKTLLRQNLEMAENKLSPTDERTLEMVCSLGNVLAKEHLFKEAEMHFRRALGVRETANVSDSKYFITLYSLADVLANQHQWNEAEELLRGGIGRTPGPSPNRLASLAYLLGEVLTMQHKFKQAEQILLHNLDVTRNTLGSEDVQTILILGNLGKNLSKQSRFSEAQKYFEQSLEARQRILGPNHRDICYTLNNLGMLCTRQRRFGEAEKLLRCGLEMANRVLTNHEELKLAVVDSLGVALIEAHWAEERKEVIACAVEGREIDVAQGRLIEGFKLLQRSAEGELKFLLDPEQTNTFGRIHNLGVAHLQQRQFTEAEHFLRLAVERREHTLGPDYPGTLMAVCNLSVAFFWQRRYNEAIALARRAFEGQHKILGPGHSWTLWSADSLIAALIQQRQYVEAERLFRDALEVQERTTFRERRDALTSLCLLCLALTQEAEFEQAVSLIEFSWGEDEEDLDLDLQDPLSNVMRSVASVLHQPDRKGELERLLQLAVKTRGVQVYYSE